MKVALLGAGRIGRLHALPIGDSFTILTRGRSGGTFKRGEANPGDVFNETDAV